MVAVVAVFVILFMAVLIFGIVMADVNSYEDDDCLQEKYLKEWKENHDDK